jgi:polygalacturonase
MNRRNFLALPALLTPARGESIRTAELQKLIDACAQRGGGTVVIPPGRHITGTLVRRSNVSLWLDPGAVLEGSRSLADYPVLPGSLRGYTDNYTDKSLIYAENAENVSIAAGA